MNKKTALRKAYGGPRFLTPLYYRQHFGLSWANAIKIWRKAR